MMDEIKQKLDELSNMQAERQIKAALDKIEHEER
jgi:hypothetical protein